MSFWNETNGFPLSPPECVKQAGRPKKLRRKGIGEVIKRKGKHVLSKKGDQRCGICGWTNHNKRSCPQNPTKGGQVHQGRHQRLEEKQANERRRSKAGRTPT
ncbi:hypothetical protein LIER_10590 [Lithospermum erythrorhizon]|uniref:Uncharacterized protein n=1 Tax=Lithospermum erythrorhizon TaxID=34254 RepID=A0AAV3PM51_LITER